MDRTDLNRSSIWWEIITNHPKTWLVIIPFAFLGSFQTIRDEFFSPYYQNLLRVPVLFDVWPRWVWLVIVLVLALFLILESAYQAIRVREARAHHVDTTERDEIIALLDDQTLSIKGTRNEGFEGVKTFPYSEVLVKVSPWLNEGVGGSRALETSVEEALKVENWEGYWRFEGSEVEKYFGFLCANNILERVHSTYRSRVVPTIPNPHGPNVMPMSMHDESQAYIAEGAATNFYMTALGNAIVSRIRRRPDWSTGGTEVARRQ